MRELLASKPSKNRTWGGGIMDEEKELIEIIKNWKKKEIVNFMLLALAVIIKCV